MMIASARTWFGAHSRDRRPPRGLSIAGAAIRYSDLGVQALALPASHHEIRQLVVERHGERGGKHKGEIGYITDIGGFVRGREALVIARQAGQIRPGGIRGDELCLDYLRPARKRAAATEPAGPAGRAASDRPMPPVGTGHFAAWTQSRRVTGQLVSADELHRQFRRTALRSVALALIVGLASMQLSGVLGSSGEGANWPNILVQTAIYLLMGLALARILDAYGSPLRRAAIHAFAMLAGLKLLWPLAFSAQAGISAIALVGATWLAALVTVVLFARIRVVGALLLVPAIIWIALTGYTAAGLLPQGPLVLAEAR